MIWCNGLITSCLWPSELFPATFQPSATFHWVLCVRLQTTPSNSTCPGSFGDLVWALLSFRTSACEASPLSGVAFVRGPFLASSFGIPFLASCIPFLHSSFALLALLALDFYSSIALLAQFVLGDVSIFYLVFHRVWNPSCRRTNPNFESSSSTSRLHLPIFRATLSILHYSDPSTVEPILPINFISPTRSSFCCGPYSLKLAYQKHWLPCWFKPTFVLLPLATHPRFSLSRYRYR